MSDAGVCQTHRMDFWGVEFRPDDKPAALDPVALAPTVAALKALTGASRVGFIDRSGDMKFLT
jgi:hypothetical protein